MEAVSSSNTRPTVAIDAEAPQSAGIEIDEPATDEVVKGNLEIAMIFRTGCWVKKLIFINQNLDID